MYVDKRQIIQPKTSNFELSSYWWQSLAPAQIPESLLLRFYCGIPG